MGKWAKKLFGKENIGDVGIIIAGTSSQEFEQQFLTMFDEVLHSKDAVYHAHLVKKGDRTYPIVLNVYGAPAMVDVLTEMHDGGCCTIIFIGYAYGGFKNLEVGSFVVPEKSYHFDGIYHAIKLDREAAFPDALLKEKIETVLKKEKIPYTQGVNISVPAVTFQLPHNNALYASIKPDTVEMELAACFSRAREIGMRAAGVLIISDNRASSIGSDEKRDLRHEAKGKLLQMLIASFDEFHLPMLKMKKQFTIDEHLASIIEDPENEVNVYRSKK